MRLRGFKYLLELKQTAKFHSVTGVQKPPGSTEVSGSYMVWLEKKTKQKKINNTKANVECS